MGLKEEIKKAIIPTVISTIIVQILFSGAFEALKIILPFFGLSLPFDLLQFLQLQFPLWATLLFFSIVAFITAFSLRSISRSKKGGFFFTVKQRPLYILEEGTYMAYGVHWNVVFGSFAPNSEPYSYVESGPLCPKCKYEMDYKTRGFLRKKRVWHCLSCDTEYDVPEDVKDVREAVEKFVDAHFRKKKIKR